MRVIFRLIHLTYSKLTVETSFVMTISHQLIIKTFLKARRFGMGVPKRGRWS